MARLARKLGLWQRVKRLALTDVGALARGLQADSLEQLERLLIEADFGVPATMELVEHLEAGVRRGTIRNERDLHAALAARLQALLSGPPDPGTLRRPASGPSVVLVIGVNGVGKTTTVAKLAHRLASQGQDVLLAAADTYRAGRHRAAGDVGRGGSACHAWPGRRVAIRRRWRSTRCPRLRRATSTPC